MNYLLEVRPTTLSFHLSVNMDVLMQNMDAKHGCFNGKTLIRLVARWPRDEGTCRRRLADE